MRLTQKSWLPEANIFHLPYGAFEVEDTQHLAVAVGTHLLDLHAAADLLPPTLKAACQAPVLNPLMSLGPRAWTLLRESLTRLLSADSPSRKKTEAALHSIAGATLVKPVLIPNHTDFYASIHHATRVGRLFRPNQPLLPNYKHIPIGYHGRASSILPSGVPIIRPTGQTRPNTENAQPNFGPSKALDYELELAFYIGQPNLLGTPIPVAKASKHLFGVSLLNDWSARDLQSWESQPLGPFLSKSFATSISPWITPMAALEPYLVPMHPRPKDDPKPLKYLASRAQIPNINLEVFLATETMRANNLAPFRLSQSSLRDLYWSPAQLIAHHTSNGCNLQTGDLLATGTISGPSDSSTGCLLELTRNGAEPIKLPTGEVRSFLSDGDEIILRAHAKAPGQPRLELGECRAAILPARRWPTVSR